MGIGWMGSLSSSASSGKSGIDEEVGLESLASSGTESRSKFSMITPSLLTCLPSPSSNNLGDLGDLGLTTGDSSPSSQCGKSLECRDLGRLMLKSLSLSTFSKLACSAEAVLLESRLRLVPEL